MINSDERMTQQEIAVRYISEMAGHYYRHFKGNLYKVLGIGVHSETAELMVAYISASDDHLWIRPLDMFLSEVDHDKYPDVKQKYRFEKVE